MPTDRPLLTYKRKSGKDDHENWIRLNTVIALCALALALGLGLGYGPWDRKKIETLQRDLATTKMLAMSTEAILNSFILNTTTSITLRSGTYDVVLDHTPTFDVIGTTTYRLEKVMVGELPIVYIEIDTFSFTAPSATVDGLELRLANPSPALTDAIALPGLLVFLPQLQSTIDKIEFTNCNTGVELGSFIIEADGTITLTTVVFCSAVNPVTVTLTDKLRIILPQA